MNISDVSGSEALSLPRWRIVAAFAFTPMIVACLFACADYVFEGSSGHPKSLVWLACVSALVYAYPATIVLGIPAFLALRKRLDATILNCAATGSLVASTPALLLRLPTFSESEFNFGHVTVENGAKTVWGWMVLGGVVGVMAAFGVLAGSIFWIIAAGGATKPGRLPPRESPSGLTR